jgi:membrane protein DedA with SNARE-associated domain
MIQHLLEVYGYVALFVLVALESVGLPLPGEAALLTAAAAVACWGAIARLAGSLGGCRCCWLLAGYYGDH